MTLEASIASKFDVKSRSGVEFCCICPWHDDTVGKLYINSVTGLYICFHGACGAKGKLGNESVPQADRCVALRDRLGAMKDKGAHQERRYSEAWLNQFIPHPYWSDVRGFSDRTIDQFRLGYDPIAGKLTIPIWSVNGGNVLGVIYRRMDDERPKYLHPKGFLTGKHLYGAHLTHRHKKVALVEGPLDAVACWDAGLPAVAAYGSRLTDGQAQLLRRLGITTLVVMTDNDQAGRDAVRSVKSVVRGVTVLVGEYEPHWSAKDPGELTKVKRKQMFHSAVPFHVWKKRA